MKQNHLIIERINRREEEVEIGGAGLCHLQEMAPTPLPHLFFSSACIACELGVSTLADFFRSN
jgi:hypothetical protein